MNLKNIYFSADQHLSHSNIIKYCNRPFRDVTEMDTTIIDNWNKTVPNNGLTYVIGDFSFKGAKNVDVYLKQLSGQKILIIGNHDSKQSIRSKEWTAVHHYHELKTETRKIILFHYGLRVWNGGHHGKNILLYGHSHGNLPGDSQCVDVGVDNGWNFTPITIEQIDERLFTHPKRPSFLKIGISEY